MPDGGAITGAQGNFPFDRGASFNADGGKPSPAEAAASAEVGQRAAATLYDALRVQPPPMAQLRQALPKSCCESAQFLAANLLRNADFSE